MLPAFTAATAATAATATTVTAATATTAAAATFTLWACFVDGDGSTIDFRAIERFDRGTSFAVIIHRHKSKSPRPTRFSVGDHSHFLDLTMSSKFGLQRILRG